MNNGCATSIPAALSGACADAEQSFSVACDLQARDALGRVEEASFWLETYQHSIGEDALRTFEIVEQIDSRVQADRLVLMREYVQSVGRMNGYREQRMWQALMRYARELTTGYETCLRLFQAGAPRASALMPKLPIIVARAMRALTLQIRYALLRYASIEPRIWQRMAALYEFAERRRFSSVRLKAYEGMRTDTTVRREYLRGLVLAVSGMESLLPASQAVAERIVAAVAEFFLLHRSPALGCHFGVALRGTSAPYRTSNARMPSSEARFFGPGDAAVMVECHLRRIVEEGVVPPELGSHATFAPALVAEVLQHLSRYWAVTPPGRREERQATITTMHVAHGFQRVLDAILSNPATEPLAEVTEVWTVENESGGGFGAVLPPLGESDWLAVGALVAAKPTWPAAWGIGVVRRVASRDSAQRSVGVELVARAGLVVQLVPRTQGVSGVALTCVLLVTEARMSSEGNELSLVLPNGASARFESAEVKIHDRSYVLTRGRICAQGDDYELTRFCVQLADPSMMRSAATQAARVFG